MKKHKGLKYSKAQDQIKHREVNKCTMTDIMFITLINYIRENGQDGIITLTNDEVTKQCINIIDSKSKLLINSGFITGDVNRSIYNTKKEKDTYLKSFMAQNEYNYTNNLFHKTLKFIEDNDYGMYFNTYKIYNTITKKSIVVSDAYDIAIISNIKIALFEHFEIYKTDWAKYTQLANSKNTRDEVQEYTKQLFEEYFKDKEENQYKKLFHKKYGINYNMIYPAYIISIFDYEQNEIDIDNYIADKVKKLNFDKTEYVEMRSKKGTYKLTYDRILKDYNSIDDIQNELDKELFDLIQNEKYFEKIQTQLYKWYTLSIFDKHQKTQYINKKEQQKLLNKANKEIRNEQIQMLKNEGYTQQEVAEELHIGIATIKRYWNI